MQHIQKPISKLFNMPSVPDAVIAKTFVLDPNTEADLIAQVPKEKAGYIFRRELMRDLLAWHNMMEEPILLFGPTQCGKTSVLRQLANRLNVPLWSITGHRQLELADLFGQYGLNETGGYIWMDGPLTLAARNGGWFMINEIDRIRPDVLVGLNDVLEMDDFTLSSKQGETVKLHPDFRIVCTANSNLAGDEGGNYNTANIHDKSVLERFGLMLAVDYPSAVEETELLSQVFSDLSDKDLELWFSEENLRCEKLDKSKLLQGEFVDRDSFIGGLINVAAMIRSQSIDGNSQSGGALERTMSTSTLLRWAQQCITFRGCTAFDLSPIHYALERSLTNGCTPTTKAVIHEIVKTVFGVEMQKSQQTI